MATNSTGLCVVSFGIALGITFSLSMFILGLLAMTGYGVAFVNLIGSVYLGYAPTFWGSVLGALWGFADGFIFGVLVAYFYNMCCHHCCKSGN